MKFGKISKPIFLREDERGIFTELVDFGEWQNLVYGKLKKDFEMGHHYHQYTIVFFNVIKGHVNIKTYNIKTGEKKSDILSTGQSYIFLPEEVRIIRATRDTHYLLMKSHRFDINKPDLIDYKEAF
jgi:hypothetical protein